MIHSQGDTLCLLASCPVVGEIGGGGRRREREGGGGGWGKELPLETEKGNRYLIHCYFCFKTLVCTNHRKLKEYQWLKNTYISLLHTKCFSLAAATTINHMLTIRIPNHPGPWFNTQLSYVVCKCLSQVFSH